MPFNTIGLDRAWVYEQIPNNTIGGYSDNDSVKDSFGLAYYGDYIDKPFYHSSKHNPSGHWETIETLSDNPTWIGNSVRDVFLRDCNALFDNPSGFYPALPEKVVNKIRNDVKIAKRMVFSYTFGGHSFWSDSERVAGLLSLISIKDS